MTQTEILEELKRLSTAERLEIIEVVLRLVREDLQHTEPALLYKQKKQHLSAAAEILRPDYVTDSELTTFIALDGEDFDAQG
ncbi:MAG TPA: hypothetical protein VIK33_05045 [Anaerolineae bacterium]